MELIVEKVRFHLPGDVFAIRLKFYFAEGFGASRRLPQPRIHEPIRTFAMLDPRNAKIEEHLPEGAEYSSVMAYLSVMLVRTIPWNHRSEMGGLQGGSLPLTHGVVRHPTQAHATVAPWLGSRPLYGVVVILRFTGRKIVQYALRTADPSRVDAYNRVAVSHPNLRIDRLPHHVRQR